MTKNYEKIFCTDSSHGEKTVARLRIGISNGNNSEKNVTFRSNKVVTGGVTNPVMPTKVDWKGKNYCIMIRKRKVAKSPIPLEIRKKYKGKRIIGISEKGRNRFFALGECEKCPGSGTWQSIFNNKNLHCFYSAYFLGKRQSPKKIKSCSLAKKECPLAK